MFVRVIPETVLTLAALRVVSTQAEKAGLTLVAARPFDIGLATALTSHHAEGGVGVAIAHPSILRTIWVAVTSWGTDRWHEVLMHDKAVTYNYFEFFFPKTTQEKIILRCPLDMCSKYSPNIQTGHQWHHHVTNYRACYVALLVSLNLHQSWCIEYESAILY